MGKSKWSHFPVNGSDTVAGSDQSEGSMDDSGGFMRQGRPRCKGVAELSPAPAGDATVRALIEMGYDEGGVLRAVASLSDKSNVEAAVVELERIAGDGVQSLKAVPYIGLQNQGTTCYLNSLCQCLNKTPELRGGLISLCSTPDTARPVCAALSSLFSSLSSASQAVGAEGLSRALTTAVVGGNAFGYEDVQEFWQARDAPRCAEMRRNNAGRESTRDWRGGPYDTRHEPSHVPSRCCWTSSRLSSRGALPCDTHNEAEPRPISANPPPPSPPRSTPQADLLIFRDP